MRKSKLLLPILAFLFAATSAFTFAPLSQTAWFHVAPNSSGTGDISNTNKECCVGRAIQCLIGNMPAYNSALAAENQNTAGLKKYNP